MVRAAGDGAVEVKAVATRGDGLREEECTHSTDQVASEHSEQAGIQVGSRISSVAADLGRGAGDGVARITIAPSIGAEVTDEEPQRLDFSLQRWRSHPSKILSGT
jgi:hypothetical protein